MRWVWDGEEDQKYSFVASIWCVSSPAFRLEARLRNDLAGAYNVLLPTSDDHPGHFANAGMHHTRLISGRPLLEVGTGVFQLHPPR